MTTRTLAAESTGPITLDTTLLSYGGTITVRAEADCDRATLTISTADETGPAAEAVRDAALRQSGAHDLHASVQGNGGSTTTIISSGGHTVVQSAGVVTGSMTGMVIDNGAVVQVGGNVVINGHRISGSLGGSSPIEIIAVVPPGSSVSARTQTADFETIGELAQVSATTHAGTVRIAHAEDITARTQTGDVRLEHTDMVQVKTQTGNVTIADFGGTAQIKTQTGDIRIHATAGGDITARSQIGDIDVTATDAALNDDLDVRPSTMTGRIRTPRRPRSQPRRRR